MNNSSLEGGACKPFRDTMDACLSDELSAESNLAMREHLGSCAKCAEELRSRQRVRSALKRVIDRQEPAPFALQQKILSNLRPQSQRNYWWLAAAAALALFFGLSSMRNFLNDGPAVIEPASSPADRTISANDLETLKIGLGDHVHCALNRDYSSGPRSFERVSQDMGPQFIGMAQLVKEHTPQDYSLMIGHRCDFNGRDFVHLILTNQRTILSVIVTKKNGVGFGKNDLTSLKQARLQDQEITGFETREYLGYVVSSLPGEAHLQLASDLAPPVHAFLARLEG